MKSCHDATDGQPAPGRAFALARMLMLLLLAPLLAACQAGAPPAPPTPTIPDLSSSALRAELITSWSGMDEERNVRHASGLAADAEGNLYVLETSPVEVKKFSPGGELLLRWKVGPAAEDVQITPVGLALDGAGHVVVALQDYDGGEQLQKFSPQGELLLAWGAAVFNPGPHRVAAAADGTIYVTDFESLRQFSPEGALLKSWGSRGRAVPFEGLGEVAVDGAGHIYVVAETQVEKFRSDGGYLAGWSLDSGDPSGGSFNAQAIALDRAGNLYIAARPGPQLQKYSPEGQLLDRFSLEIGDPAALAVGLDGTIYVADYGQGRIQLLSPDGEVVSSWGIWGTGRPGTFSYSSTLAVDDLGQLYIADRLTGSVQKLQSDGQAILRWAHTVKDRRGRAVALEPYAIAANPAGALYIAYWGDRRVLKFDDTGQLLGPASAGEEHPQLVAVDAANHVYVLTTTLDPAQGARHVIEEYGPAGERLRSWPVPHDEQSGEPVALAVDGAGNIYVAQSLLPMMETPARSQVMMFRPGGELAARHFLGDEPRITGGMAVDSVGNIYVTNVLAGRVEKYRPTGELLMTWAYRAAQADEFLEGSIFSPIAVDRAGQVYVLDLQSLKLHVFRQVLP